MASTAACLAWGSIPPHRRQLTALWVARAAVQVAGWLARHTGRAAMARELAGRGQSYDVPYLLSLARERAAAAYTRWRMTP
jgi:hypothetical protein